MLLEPFTLRSLPETEAVSRLLDGLLSPAMRTQMVELHTWCRLRDEERGVCDQKWNEKKAIFAAEWQDYPPVIEHEGNTYRKQDACWTLDGGGLMGAAAQASEEAVRAAWEKVRPKGATVTVVGGNGG